MQNLLIGFIITITIVIAGIMLYKRLSVFRKNSKKCECSACDTCAMKGNCNKTEKDCDQKQLD